MLWRNKTDKTFFQLSVLEWSFNRFAETSIFKPVYVGQAGQQPGRVSTDTMNLFLESNVASNPNQLIDHFLPALINNQAIEVEYNYELYNFVDMGLDKIVLDYLCNIDSDTKQLSFLF